MKNIFILIAILFSVSAYTQERDIWVISNIKITKSDKEVDLIVNQSEYSTDDILVFHGNALTSLSRASINAKVKKFRSKFERVFIVPGRKDWSEMKSKKLKSLGDYLDDEYKGDVIVPENACGTVELKDINSNLSLAFLDSDWYFRDWQGDKNINEKCEVTSRFSFWEEVNGEIGKLKAKQVILFATDPLFRNDRIGGHLRLKDHLLPLPILGTVIQDTRNYLSYQNNTFSPIYQDYISQMSVLVENHPKMAIVSSAARRNYVYSIEGNSQLNVNTSKTSYSKHEDDNLVFDNGEPCILHIHISGKELNSTYISLSGEVLHSQLLMSGKPFVYDASAFKNFNPAELDKKVTRKVRLDKDRVDFNNFLFGDLNKELYKAEVTVDQLNLSTAKGGLRPLRLGGGKQTNSMRLVDSSGYVYVTRSLKKNPEKSLPPGLDVKPLERLMENFFMAADPLAFLTTPTLDKAANVYHMTPKLVLLPKQPSLSVFNDQIGGELVLFRERADDAWPEKKSFGYSENIINSADMLEELADNKATVDANMFLRARLLDLVIGDWDRHSDQWRWAQGKDEDIYYPIARDRDQVYANFDGLLLTLARPYNTNTLQLRKFDDALNKDDIRWMHWKSAILDNSLLLDVTEKDWAAQTAYMKEAINENVMDEATQNLPPSYGNRKEVIKKNVLARMADLDQISEDFRAELLHRGWVKASNDEDSIIIVNSASMIKIDVYTDYKKKNDPKYRSYTFHKNETKDVWLYGLEDDDLFTIQGPNDGKIKLLLVGGYGKDVYASSENYKNIKIIDDEPEESVERTTPINYFYTERKIIHDLTRWDFTPRHKYFMPSLAYNSDDGFFVGGAYNWIDTGFKNKTTQTLSGSYMTNRNSSILSYRYSKTDFLTNTTKYFGVNWSGLRRALFYYGGNGSSNNGDNGFYQVGIQDVRMELGKIKILNSITDVETGLYGWSVKVEDEDSRYVSQDTNVNQNVFEREYFVGAKTALSLSNTDNPLRPTKLARIKLGVDYKYAIESKRSNILFLFEYDYYKPLIGEDRLLISTKVRAGHLIGEYYLYEGLQLGGSDMLRGYRNGRFTGRSMVAQNINLQIKIADRIFGSNVKCSGGLSAGFDHGRTWSDFDVSEAWQYSYGGGVWLSPLDQAVFSVGMYQPVNHNENLQLRILFNWQF